MSYLEWLQKLSVEPGMWVTARENMFILSLKPEVVDLRKMAAKMGSNVNQAGFGHIRVWSESTVSIVILGERACQCWSTSIWDIPQSWEGRGDWVGFTQAVQCSVHHLSMASNCSALQLPADCWFRAMTKPGRSPGLRQSLRLIVVCESLADLKDETKAHMHL